MALGALAVAGLVATGANAAPAATSRSCVRVVERFISADCADCWARAEPVAPGSFELDWILPTSADAPLEAAALIEAEERRQRAQAAVPTPTPTSADAGTRTQPLRAAPGLRLAVDIGPAWHGYLGLRLTVRGRLPAGATGWVALVEALPAGSEGNPTARSLVRAVAGPLNLDGARGGRPLSHLQSMRWPETARPERLQARGWIETGGRVLAVAGAPCGPGAGTGR